MKTYLFLSTLSLIFLPLAAAQASITVEATFGFGLFEKTEGPLSAPTQEQLTGLLTRMSEWYTGQLAQKFPTLVSFQAVYLCHTYDAGAERPITIDVDGKAFFEDDGQTLPTKWDVSTAMESLNYQELITVAVWTTDQSGGIFEEVNLATFASRDANTPVVCNQISTTESEEISEEAEPSSATDPPTESEEISDEAEASSATGPPSLCEEFPTDAVLASRAANEEDPVHLFDPACLEQQSCPSALETTSGSIHCSFSLVTKGFVYNDDYPECTESHHEETRELGELVTIPLPLSSHHVVTPLPIEIDSDRYDVHENVTVSWGLGTSCDGRVGLFYRGPIEGGEEYTLVAIEPLDALLQGNNIAGSGWILGGGQAIHRNRRRTHVGCAIGGFHEFWLQGTCYHEEKLDEDTSSDDGSTADEPSLDSEDGDASSSPGLVASGFAWLLSSFVLVLLAQV